MKQFVKLDIVNRITMMTHSLNDRRVLHLIAKPIEWREERRSETWIVIWLMILFQLTIAAQSVAPFRPI